MRDIVMAHQLIGLEDGCGSVTRQNEWGQEINRDKLMLQLT